MRAIITLLIITGLAPSVLGQDGFVAGSPQLAYWKLGGHLETVIVLHGGPAVQHEYLRPEFDLLNRFCSVIYYDQRGCGRSQQAASYEWQEHVRDLQRVKRALSPKKKVFLAGSSWGSTLAIIYAYMHPEDVKGIILTGTYKWEGKNTEYIRIAFPPTVHSHKQSLSEKGILQRTNVDGSVSEVPITIWKETEMYTEAPAFETRASVISAPTLDSLRNIHAPILLFGGGAHCRIDYSEELMAIFPHAELCTIEEACHDPWMSAPERFATTCEKFVAKNKH
ncbi:alpha/beta fold hydrolase [Dyadobacter fermentans]|uniref:alpha/beta fold hydrolase n=1 Tax=Dyadobacter fermentans TaxID=94254 RepID=UPI001CBC0AF1|nr:alpha/beta hydrolase [Dyadobacter fermentans]MBZ1361275.1 alpha/beta hydrolase [Dyadobacter fermentans]